MRQKMICYQKLTEIIGFMMTEYWSLMINAADADSDAHDDAGAGAGADADARIYSPGFTHVAASLGRSFFFFLAALVYIFSSLIYLKNKP